MSKTNRSLKSPSILPLSAIPPLDPSLHLLAASFLFDYELGAPPSLTLDASGSRIRLYFLRRSKPWRRGVQPLAAAGFFLSSFFEDTRPLTAAALSGLGCAALALDLTLAGLGGGAGGEAKAPFWSACGLVLAHSVEVGLWLRAGAPPTVLLSNFLKPAALFHLLPSAAESLRSFLLLLPTAFKINSFLLSLILLFSLVASSLFSHNANFYSVSRSFVTLFALSTSVNNPACWMELYKESQWNALFFIVFLLSTLFYLQVSASVQVVRKTRKRERLVTKRYKVLAPSSSLLSPLSSPLPFSHFSFLPPPTSAPLRKLSSPSSSNSTTPRLSLPSPFTASTVPPPSPSPSARSPAAPRRSSGRRTRSRL